MDALALLRARLREREATRASLRARLLTAVAGTGRLVGALPLVFVSCSAEKRDTGGGRPELAERLYTSELFTRSLAYARTLVPDNQIRILSARHYAIGLCELVRPYNEALDKKPKLERLTWGETCARLLAREFASYSRHVTLLAGDTYTMPLRRGAWLRGLRWHFSEPLARLPIGPRLHWLGELLDQTGGPLLPTPDEERAAVLAYVRENAAHIQALTGKSPAALRRVVEDVARRLERREIDETRHAIELLREHWDAAGPPASKMLETIITNIENAEHRAGLWRPPRAAASQPHPTRLETR